MKCRISMGKVVVPLPNPSGRGVRAFRIEICGGRDGLVLQSDAGPFAMTSRDSSGGPAWISSPHAG
jgi:hypothetical protein